MSANETTTPTADAEAALAREETKLAVEADKRLRDVKAEDATSKVRKDQPDGQLNPDG